MRKYWELFQRTAQKWKQDDVSNMAAALAYYTAVSIAPLSLLIIVVAGFLWGAERAARAELMQYVQRSIGQEGAQFVEMIVRNADRPTFGSIAGLIGLLTLIWGATNVFTHLQVSLNTIWNVPQPDNVLLQNVKRRFLSFAMVLAIAFVLMVSLALSTALNALAGDVQQALPGGDWVWRVGSFLFSTALTTILFAAIYKVIPDAVIDWGDVWLGAALTALLYGLGKFGLSYYLAQIGSSYGAAGSMIAFLLWVFFSAQILLIGAAFIQVYMADKRDERRTSVAEQRKEPAPAP